MALALISHFIRQQFLHLPSLDAFKVDLRGKTVVVVGSNTGLGFESAKHLASMMLDGSGGRLILACRSVERGNTALEAIKASTGFPGCEVWQVDLASFASVKAFATKFETDGGGHLDLLIMNSGISTFDYAPTEDGWESTLQVNHLGTALLSLLLLPYIFKADTDGPCPRLVVVASEGHFLAKLKKPEDGSGLLSRIGSKEYCSPSAMEYRYFESKLLNVFFVRALAKRIPGGSPVSVVAANPGFCRSSITRNIKQGSLIYYAFRIFQYLMARPSEEGGRSITYAAVAGAQEGLDKPFHGQFVSTCEITQVSKFCLSEEGQKIQEDVWVETIEILSKIDDRIPNIVSLLLELI